jgi:aerobic-type carbon monoxide dehydrogenase small subunit (CoxS/CutS family)
VKVPVHKMAIRVEVNGRQHEQMVESRLLLSDFLRHTLGFTGTRVGCEHGVCGACTILLNDTPVRSCLMFAVQVDGQRIRTVEGLADGPDELGLLQQAFRDRHAVQCGFCTAGLLTTLTAYLAQHADPTEADVREAISGNLCRCTGYQNVVAAALLAATRMRERREAARAG